MLQQLYALAYDAIQILAKNNYSGHARTVEAVLDVLASGMIDEVTKLTQRRPFFKTLVEELRTKFPNYESDGLIPDCITNLTVLVGDIAYLNWFNSISHNFGNEMLERVARILDSHFGVNCWVARVGGDEIGIWSSTLQLDILLTLKKRAEDEIEKEAYDRIDMEYATTDDVLRFFKSGVQIERTYSALAQLLFDIAFARSQITKCYQRILFLIQLRIAEDSTYEVLIPYARKGAGNITDREIDVLAEKVRNGTDVLYECLAYALRKRQEATGGIPYEEAVCTVASDAFYEER